MRLNLFVLAIGSLVVPSLQYWGPVRDINVTHVWKNLEYSFDDPDDYEYVTQNGIYTADGFKRPYDADIHFEKSGDTRVFITTPKLVPGIPYTLAKVSNRKGNYGPRLLPYPNFAAHSSKYTSGCRRIISVFRIFVDPCQRLWAIDTGRNFNATPTQVCPPKILVFDLETDELLLRYVIPEDQFIPEKSVHNSIIVDIYDPPPRGKCEKGKAYITDARGYSLLVFDLENRTSWVIFNDFFKPDPAFMNTTIAGESFQFPDGIYTSTPNRRKDKIYLHSFASLYEIAAPLSLVNDQSIWKNNSAGNQQIFQVTGIRPTQSPTETRDGQGNIYFSILNPLSIVSWNPDRPYKMSNFKSHVENPDTLQFVAGLKIRTNNKREEVLVALSNRLQKLVSGTASLDDENFRLMICKVSTLQAGHGKCGGL